MRRLLRALQWTVALVLVLVCVLWAFLGGGARLEDRTTAPMLRGDALEKVADLSHPPGNVAVAADGRVFFTYHPDVNPPEQVMELTAGGPVAYPSPGYPLYQSVLALRIDRRGRLWALDHARLGRGRPRILRFDLATDEVDTYNFPREVAPFGSMLNDFQVSPDGRWIFIAEASPLFRRPAIVVYDTEEKRARRVLDGHRSVMPLDFAIHAPGRRMAIFGLLTLRIGVDSIALDRRGEWLYFGPVNGDRLYRAPTRALVDPSLTAGALGVLVEDWAEKTISDGLTTDDAGRIYMTDPEHSAIHVIRPDGSLETLVRDARLRWPDGLSFGPDGWLYVTCSALHQVLFRPEAAVAEHAPYQIFRIRPPGATGTPGH